MLKEIQKRLRKFQSDQSGGGTVFGLFMLVTIAMVVGLALDFSNAWRNRTYLSSTADIAAHAGAVAIVEGATIAQVEARIQDIVEFNMPTSLFGAVLDTTADISFAEYDPDTKSFGNMSSTDPNAVVVELHLADARGNSISTNLLQLVGINSLDLEAISASVADHSANCSFSDGIFAKDQVTITSQADVGGGICVHSEDFVWLPQQNTFQPGSMVSMPNLSDCGNKCNTSANPGINPVEAHMVLGDFGDKITSTYAAFLEGINANPIKSGFFNDDPLDPLDPQIVLGDISALTAMGYSPTTKGDVVSMSRTDFTSLAVVPSGLVYEVICTANGNGPNTKIEFSGSVAQMDGSVLLTNCGLDFASGSSVRSSVVVTTRVTSNAAITADNNVAIGDPTQSCAATERSFIMSNSKVTVPSEFVMSNVTLVVDDDVNIASATSSGVVSHGFAVYATGKVHIASQHTFRSCGHSYTGGISPEGKVLRLVVPPLI